MPDDAPTLIFETVHGSRAYGLERPESDTDLKGAVVGPPSWYFGLHPGPEQVELDPDHVRYELRKLLRLAVANNPTILELFFTRPEDHRVVTEAGERLLALGPSLLSRRVADTFAGYAASQLSRIRTHRRWLLEPPTEEPRREAFGLPARPRVSRDQLGAAEAMLEDGRLHEGDLSEGFLDLLAREKRYRAARKEWEQHRGWVKNRNPARAALEARHGYDTKHAMHLVRLLRMAREVLTDGELRVYREDREELLAIRDGEWSYEELVAWADEAAAEVRTLKGESPLPEAPDEAAVEALCVALVAETLAGA